MWQQLCDGGGVLWKWQWFVDVWHYKAAPMAVT
jgi:hypothetical protein